MINSKPINLTIKNDETRFAILNSIARELSIEKEENSKLYDPINIEDLTKIKKALVLMRASHATRNVGILYRKLDFINNFINRFGQFPFLAQVKENNIINILIDLSMSDHTGMRNLSISILASLTFFLPETIDDLLAGNFNESICMNLQMNYFPEQKFLFRWIYNFLEIHIDQAQLFFEKLPVDVIFDASIEFVVNSAKENSYAPYLFYRISLINNLTYEQVKNCVEFFYFYTWNAFSPTYHKKGLKYVLHGIHSIISNKNYPKENLCEFVSDLKLTELVVKFIVIDGKIDRKLAFSILLIGDMFELGIFENLQIFPRILELSADPTLVEWLREIIYFTIRKTLNCCDQEVVMHIWQNGSFLQQLVFMSNNSSIIVSTEVAFCIMLLLNRVDLSEISHFIVRENITALVQYAFSDNADVVGLLANGLIRLIQFAETNNLLNLLYEHMINTDGFGAVEDFVCRQIIPEELAFLLQQEIKKLD